MRTLRQVSEAFDGARQPGGTNRLIATDTEYGDLGQVERRQCRRGANAR